MAKATQFPKTVGVFVTRDAAERAVADLQKAGYADDQIGLVGKDSSGRTVSTDAAGETKAAEGAGTGAALGAAAGATGMALGSLAIAFGVIPVIGPVLAVGPLAAALISAAGGAAGGAAAGGLVGGLIGWGVPEEDAKYYEGEVKAGRYLVTVDSRERAGDVSGVFTRHGGYDRSNAPRM